MTFRCYNLGVVKVHLFQVDIFTSLATNNQQTIDVYCPDHFKFQSFRMVGHRANGSNKHLNSVRNDTRLQASIRELPT